MHPSAPLLMLLATAASAPLAPAFGEPGQTSLTGRIVVRVETTMRAVPVAVRWVEKSGPKCVPIGQLAGAIVNGTDSVDLVLKGGARFRAQFDDDCAALGYYGGFYLKSASDGQVCAGRDTIRTRSGDSCSIGKFKRLIPKVEKPRKP
ncbi:hypothetical protein FPZ24_01675 [Sphingomonas panacisoli]|uniref:Uncharacterized protein n=1 Tax=Sphingomonas panacisoli TaxID=1813879 RepID=A0A5B8LDT3_9SPHN|nr:hypothetical protein [Sphingomonas panacisoli]QDZ06338.1 hypothetical protein FPZ24_01675 [Sphingomonas panacisoli]